MDDDTTSDQRLEHQRNPPEFIDVKQLFNQTGVEYFKVSWNQPEIMFNHECDECKKIF